MWNSLENKGQLLSLGKLKVFFGNRLFNPQRENINKIQFYKIHQVHGKKMVRASSLLQKADAHWTNKRNQALLIQTADCMPAFLSNKKRSFVCALHIGWRSLAQKILSHSMSDLPSTDNLELWVGPHIKTQSFCLDPMSTKDLLKEHNLTIKKAQSLGILYPTPHRLQQFSIDLDQILQREANSLHIKVRSFSEIDTFRSIHHYSHRRYPFGGGRQWSFSVLTT